MKKQLLLTTLILFAIILLFANTNVQANFQSKPWNSTSELSQTQLNYFMYQVRQMETDGQVMGLSETGDFALGGTLLANTSNNIDVHLQKNTEYGAVVLLSASPQYGKQGTGRDSYINSTSNGLGTTTGNQYGVYDMGQRWEWTAGGGKNSYYNGGYKAIPYNPRYYDIYEELVSKPGDATTETSRWKGSSFASFVNAHGAFIRGSSGAFSFSNYGSSVTNYGRAAVVCGSGF